MKKLYGILFITAALAVIATSFYFVGFSIASSKYPDLSGVYQRLDDLLEKEPQPIEIPTPPEPNDLSELYRLLDEILGQLALLNEDKEEPEPIPEPIPTMFYFPVDIDFEITTDFTEETPKMEIKLSQVGVSLYAPQDCQIEINENEIRTMYVLNFGDGLEMRLSATGFTSLIADQDEVLANEQFAIINYAILQIWFMQDGDLVNPHDYLDFESRQPKAI
jgi:hypothetical protein